MKIYQRDYRQSVKIVAPSIVRKFVTVTKTMTSDDLLESIEIIKIQKFFDDKYFLCSV